MDLLNFPVVKDEEENTSDVLDNIIKLEEENEAEVFNQVEAAAKGNLFHIDRTLIQEVGIEQQV